MGSSAVFLILSSGFLRGVQLSTIRLMSNVFTKRSGLSRTTTLSDFSNPSRMRSRYSAYDPAMPRVLSPTRRHNPDTLIKRVDASDVENGIYQSRPAPVVRYSTNTIQRSAFQWPKSLL